MMAALIAATAATATAQHLSKAELLQLADEALTLEHKHAHDAVDRYLLVAIALRESSGNPNAVGDGGKAVGLFQFHVLAWWDAWASERDNYPGLVGRRNPKGAFRAAVRWLSWGARRIEAAQRKDGKRPNATAALIATFHNTGQARTKPTKYGLSVRSLRLNIMRRAVREQMAARVKP